MRPPIGFVADRTGPLTLDPDTQIQQAVRLLFETFPLFLLLLFLRPVAVRALLVVIGLERHVGHSLFKSGSLSLFRSPWLGSARSRRRRYGLKLLVFRLLGETQLAESRRLERDRFTLALLLELEGLFPLLRLAQKRLGIAPCCGVA